MKNEIYPIYIQEPTGTGVRTREDWAYSCGHCCAVVVMHPLRQRPRETCYACGRWICEQNELCHETCTPIYNIAADNNEGVPNKWKKVLSGIMAGETKVEEAKKKGLILPVD